MNQVEPTPPARPDNLFGICHGVAATFGFDPVILRLLFLAAMLADFRAAVIGYAALGLLLAVSMALTGELRLRQRAGASLTS